MKYSKISPGHDREDFIFDVNFAAYNCTKSSRETKLSRSCARLVSGGILKYRAISAIAASAVVVGSLVLSAAPASAIGSPRVGCVTGSSCIVELNYNVTYTGSSGGHNGVVVTPPPCIGVPAGNAHAGSEAIITLYSNSAPVQAPNSPDNGATPADTPTAQASAAAMPASDLTAQQRQIFSQARQLVNSDPITPGEWYQIAGNPSATSAAQQKCLNLPPYMWVPGGSSLMRVDGVKVPPETLAALAYSQLTTAKLSKVTLNPKGASDTNPKGASDTNLPTFVDVALQQPARGVLEVTPKGDPYVWATAATPDGQSATVWAWVTGMTIAPGTANAMTFNQQRCSVAHLSGHTFMLGSRYSATAMTNVGAGQQIDCGVTYTAPGTYGLTANVTWNACWSLGTATTNGPPPGCKPVPGASALAPSTSPADQVTVREIQSVNNG